jgi:hypothetical protein
MFFATGSSPPASGRPKPETAKSSSRRAPYKGGKGWSGNVSSAPLCPGFFPESVAPGPRPVPKSHRLRPSFQRSRIPYWLASAASSAGGCSTKPPAAVRDRSWRVGLLPFHTIRRAQGDPGRHDAVLAPGDGLRAIPEEGFPNDRGQNSTPSPHTQRLGCLSLRFDQRSHAAFGR